MSYDASFEGSSKKLCLYLLMSPFSVLSFDLQLQSFLQIVVFQIRVDECPSSGCAGASGCTNVLNVRDTPMVVDCGTMSLVSVTLESTAVCSCPGRDQTHQPCSAYPRNPCFNGGVCLDTQHGYRWVDYLWSVLVTASFIFPTKVKSNQPLNNMSVYCKRKQLLGRTD